jgi:DNA invertase Pin-like site-specific DNA recombinase
MLVGYARVSTFDQSNALQVSAFKKSGIQKIHEEKQSSIKHRPVLERLIEHELKPGDVLCVYKLDRLARSMSHFVRIFERLKAKNIGFKSLTESIETETPQGRMFVQLLGVFAEFERELIRERCLAGQVAARARGQVWGKKPLFTPDEALKLAGMWRSGWYQHKTLAMMFECHEATIRDTIHKAENRGRWKRPASDK